MAKIRTGLRVVEDVITSALVGKVYTNGKRALRINFVSLMSDAQGCFGIHRIDYYSLDNLDDVSSLGYSGGIEKFLSGLTEVTDLRTLTSDQANKLAYYEKEKGLDGH